MALNPEISLGVRPPVIQPLQIQNPLEQFAKVQTLRNLMQEQQSGQLGLQAQQLKLDEAQRGIADEQSLRDLLIKNPNAGAAEVIGAGGPVRGMAWLKSQQEAEKARLDRLTQANTLNVNNAKRRAQIAAGVTDLESAKKAAWQAANEGVYDIDPAKNAQIARDVLQHLQTNGFIPDEWKQHAQESLDYVARQELADKVAEEERKKAKAPFELRTATAGATKAEQEAAGTQPITPQQKAQAEAQLWTDPGGLIAIMNDPNRSAADKARAAAGLEKHEGLKRAGAATNNIITPNQNIANEAKLRDDYARDTKEYVTIRNAYNKIVGAAKSASAAGDIGLVYGFMKLQDPGSTVREGEFATAQNAGGIPERVRAMYNKAVNGERLDPSVRKDFVAQAEKIHEQYNADYLKTKDMYTGIAQRGGMDPRNVVIDYSTAKPAGGLPKATDPKLKSYADDYFGGDIAKAQAAIAEQQKGK